MGNYLSCSLSPAGGVNSSTKIILPSGEIHHLSSTPAMAAELMLEHPGYFLAHSSAILINRRLFALSADEDLEIGAVYAMFPMDRVGSVASAADMGRLLLSAGKNSLLDRAQSAQSAHPEKRLKLDEMDDALVSEFRVRRSACRSRRQILETITEEPVF